MLHNIFFAAAAILSVIGTVSLISLILLRLLKPKKDENFTLITVFGKDDGKPEVRISRLISLLSTLGVYGKCTVFAVDDGLSEIQRGRLDRAFQREKNIKICKKDKLCDEIFKK